MPVDASRFYVDPLGGQGPAIIQGLGSVAEDFIGRRKAKKQQETRNAEILEATRSQDPDQIAEVSLKYPEFAEQIQKTFGIFNEETKEIASRAYRQAITNPDNPQLAIEALRQGIEDVEAAGGSPDNMRADLASFERGDPNIIKQIELTLAGAAPELYKAIQDQKKAELGDTPRIKDFRRWKAMPEGDEKKGFGRMIGATSRHESVEDYSDRKKVDADIKLKLAKDLNPVKASGEAQKDFAKAKTKWQLGQPSYIGKIDSAKASQGILDATANEIKANLGQLTTAYGASLKNIPGSESRKLKGQLDTLRAHSAFSTLTDLKAAGGTLGAISSSELVLLEAKLGTLDQGGQAAEMIRVIDQITNFNRDSITRLQNEYDATNAMFAGEQQQAQANRDQQELEKNAPQAADGQSPIFSQKLGREITEQDIADTLAANPGVTREQLLQQLQVQ